MTSLSLIKYFTRWENEMEIAGKKVVDATKPATIHITKHDAKVGDNKNPSGCAAAIAAKRDIADCLSARVHIGRVYIEQKNKWIRYQTPDSLRSEIIAFDRGGSFQPGVYQLRPVAPSQTAEAQAERYKANETRHLRASSPNKPRKQLRVAKVKRHEVSGVRPKGAVR